MKSTREKFKVADKKHEVSRTTAEKVRVIAKSTKLEAKRKMKLAQKRFFFKAEPEPNVKTHSRNFGEF